MEPMPTKIERVQIELTNACNFSCDFCPRGKLQRRTQHMHPDTFKRAVDEIVGERIAETISLHVLGEPLVCPHVFESIAYAKNNGLRVEMTTNGSLLRPDRVARLAEEQLDCLTISLSSTDPAEHEFRRTRIPFDRYYDRILEAVHLARALEPKMLVQLRLMSTWSKSFFSVPLDFHLNRRQRLFRERIARLVAAIYDRRGVDLDRGRVEHRLKQLSLRGDLTIVLEEGLELLVRTFADWGNAFTEKRVYPARVGYCSAALKTASILSNGDVVPCSIDYEGEARLGNIHDQTLGALLRAPRARQMVEGFRRCRVVDPMCQRCLGASTRIRALIKGLLSIWLFKVKDPTAVPSVRLFPDGLLPPYRPPLGLPAPALEPAPSI
jgi:radical SAM protein with 4Fe4S-binding SPASM domain